MTKVTIEFESLEAAAAAFGKVLVNQTVENLISKTIEEPKLVPVVPEKPAAASEPAKKKKRKRRTKAEIEAAKVAEAVPAAEPPAVEEDDPFADVGSESSGDDGLFDDDPPAAVEVTVTVEDVRAVLIEYKNAYAKKAVLTGEDEKKATADGMTAARNILKKAAGTEVLGDLKPENYAAVVAEAKARIAKLA